MLVRRRRPGGRERQSNANDDQTGREKQSRLHPVEEDRGVRAITKHRNGQHDEEAAQDGEHNRTQGQSPADEIGRRSGHFPALDQVQAALDQVQAALEQNQDSNNGQQQFWNAAKHPNESRWISGTRRMRRPPESDA